MSEIRLLATSDKHYLKRSCAGETAEVVEGVEAGGVAVGPDGLDGVAADVDDAHELKGAGGKVLGGIFIDVAHDVYFAAAPGTGTMPAHGFQRDETLGPVIPF